MVMKRNVTRIRLTEVKVGGRAKEACFRNCLWLRHARNVGDEENVNNTVLGHLRRYPNFVTFEIVEQ
jgi:hypothetical protein